MTTLFISDLHIDASRPDICTQFLTFLQTEAAAANALYILGDLFESWVGDDAPDAAQESVMAGLRELTAQGVPCFVMHGNRDFLLGSRFAMLTGSQLLADPSLLTLYGESVLVMHGDALCTDDHAYQRLRAIVRDPVWQARFLQLPIATRRALASTARGASREHTASLKYAITDVNADSVAAILKSSASGLLLHGHTHRPAVHEIKLEDRRFKRIVLGDWYTQGSVVRWDSNGPSLSSLNR